MSENRTDTAEKWEAGGLAQGLLLMADRFENLAKSLRRDADDVYRVGRPSHGTYAHVAQHAQHEVITALANAHLDVLTRQAAGADVARAKGE